MRSLIFVSLVLLCSLPARSDPPGGITPAMAETATRLMTAALSDNIAYPLVESLTTEIGPRLAGTRAEQRARDWAVARLRSLGFSNVRVEPFAVPLWLRGTEHGEILDPFPQPLAITALGGSTATGPGGISGEIVSFPNLEKLLAAPDGSQAGKIVFVDEPMTRTQDGSGYGEAVRKRYQTTLEAARVGASAALIRSVGTSHHRFPHTGAMGSYEVTARGVPTAALSAPDADQLRRALSRGKPVTVRLVITPQLLPPVPSGNVVAEIPGRERPEEIVLVGAHLDSWDLGTGAVDDGAGVGIVVAAAKVLLDTLQQPPRRTIRVVLFGSEEVGIVGARAYAAAHAAELDRHVVATESDFGAGNIWRFDTGMAEQKIPLARQLAEVMRPLGIAPGNNEASGGPDITPLKQAGVPVVGLKQNGWDYFDLHHTPDDTLDKISARDLDQNVAAYAAFLFLAAEMQGDFRAAPE